MKKIWTVGTMFLAIGFVSFLYAQDKQDQPNQDDQMSQDQEPKVDIKVKKETDENGNVTRYDSTYTWSWSSNGILPENIQEDLDNMLGQFNLNSRINFNDSSFSDEPFKDLFDNDVLQGFQDLQFHFRNFDQQYFEDLKKNLENMFDDEFLGEMKEQLQNQDQIMKGKMKDLEEKLKQLQKNKENNITEPGGKVI